MDILPVTDAPLTRQLSAARYLVCVDARDESRVALRLACLKARLRGCTVSMLHVVPMVDFQGIASVAEHMREEQRREAMQMLQRLAAEASELYGVSPTLMLREGTAGDEIIAAISEDPHINVLVLGIAQQSSGRGKLATWLASQLGVRLLTPILMVPGNLTEQQLQTLI